MSNAEAVARYRKAHPDLTRKWNRAWQHKHRDILRVEVLTHYGPSGQLCCSWENCHISDPDMLVLDHIENNGAAERKELNLRGWNFYRHLKSHFFPEGYQTLCCNHNHKKEIIRSRAARKVT